MVGNQALRALPSFNDTPSFYFYHRLESTLIPYSASQNLPAKVVLILAPHPDDEVFGCAGTLARHVRAGCQVEVIVLTDGAFGAVASQKNKIIATRQAESCAAADVLGYPPPTFWGLPDRGIEYGEALIFRVMGAIRAVNADLVYAPALTEIHPDHRALAMVAVEAIRRLGAGVRLAMYEIGVPLSPNVLLDISDLAELKLQAMRCFASQLALQPYDDHIAALNRFRTYTLPVPTKMAEAFCLHDGAQLAQSSLDLFDSEYVRQAKLGIPVLGPRDIPLVSVVVRSMDREMLGDALDSLSLQTYQNLEVIVVNAKGGSHFALGSRCGRFPMHLANTNGKPLSRGAAANVGLRATTGELLAFLDDDDTLDPDHFSSLVDIVKSNAPGRIVAYSGVRAVERQGNSSTILREFVQAEFNPQRLLLGNFMPIHAPLFPKALLGENVAFDEGLDLYEDWDFWVQLSELAPFVYSGRITATYFMGGRSGVSPLAPNHEIARSASLKYFKKWSQRLNGEQLSGISQLYLKLDEAHSQTLSQLNIATSNHDQAAASLNTVQGKLDFSAGTILELKEKQVALYQSIHEQKLAQQQALDLGQTRQREQELEREQQQAHVNQLAQQLTLARSDIVALQTSTSWRVASPVRLVGRQLLRMKITAKALAYAASVCGGYGGLLQHAWRAYRDEGFTGIRRRAVFSAARGAPASLIAYSGPQQNDYNEWLRQYDTLTDQGRKKVLARINQFQNQPLISVLMPVYNPPLEMLENAILSVQKQIYPNWELCIADDASTHAGVLELLQRHAAQDARIKLALRQANGHISAASNSALALASGTYVALLDNDDLLHELALFWVADAIAANPDAGLIYSDEDKVDVAGNRFDPYFKPDWNPDLFRSHNMVCHLGVYSTDLARKLGGFREGFEGAQDYDLALRCSEQLAARQIVHIARVLYHWRSHPGSTAQAGSEKGYALLAGQRALDEHFSRTGVSAKAELLDFGMYRAHYALPSASPLVSLIIPTRNGLHLVKQCIDSIFAKTSYENYEIIIIDNNSDDPATLDYFASLAGDARIRILRDESPFNFSALNNAAVLQAKGEYIGLLNNDVEVISPQWLEEMMGLAIQPGVGAVGARLWYPNNTLQHGGVITGLGGVAGHSHKHLERGAPGYFYHAQLIKTLSVVTAACLVIKKSIFLEVGGFNETDLKIAFNDVDFCLRVRQAGYRNIWTPYAELFHHESATRGYEDTPEKQLRFAQEVKYLKERWGESLTHDPAYSPNLTLDREDFSYAWPPRVSAL